MTRGPFKVQVRVIFAGMKAESEMESFLPPTDRRFFDLVWDKMGDDFYKALRKHDRRLRRARRGEIRYALRVPPSIARERVRKIAAGEPVPLPDFERDKMLIVTGFMQFAESKITKGHTTDNLQPIIDRWAGPLAKHVKLVKPGARRRGDAGVLYLECEVSVIKFELARKLKSLVQQTAPLGFTEVRIR